MYEYELVRSNRRTIAVTINRAGRIRVLAPHNASRKYIDQFARDKAGWVQKKLKAIEASGPKIKTSGLNDDQSIDYLGRNLSISMRTGLRTTVRREKNNLWLENPFYNEDQNHRAVDQWIRIQAGRVFLYRLRHMKRLVGRHFELPTIQLKIRKMTRRFGSMNKKGNLLLNLRLIHLDISLLDYVIVHELCHLVHFNHSPAFWQAVRRCMPDYKWRHQQLLKYNFEDDFPN